MHATFACQDMVCLEAAMFGYCTCKICDCAQGQSDNNLAVVLSGGRVLML